MKKNSPHALLRILTVSCIPILLAGCFKDRITKTYTILRPVYTPKVTVLASINGNSGQSFDTVGKIYIKGPWVFLNEVDKGIHIIDNSDPAHPVQTAFLNIPGNRDIAVKGNTLYADMYSDLLAIDISNPHQVSVTGIAHGVFPDHLLFSGGYLVNNNGILLDSSQVLTGWIKKDTTVNVDDPPSTWGRGCAYCMNYSASGASDAKAGIAAGVAGSMAKMVLVNDYIYAISRRNNVVALDISNAPRPILTSSTYAGVNLETIYPFRDKLFLGSQEGMYIFDISNPVLPVRESRFTHIRSCDPVVTDGDYAYITLHAGTACGGITNELDIVNVQNLRQPKLVKIYPMTKPQGLCKDGQLLFVCDSSQGVKLYDASDPAGLQLVTQIGRTDAYDVIAANHRLLVTASQGLYQYDYTNIHQISLLSFFPVK